MPIVTTTSSGLALGTRDGASDIILPSLGTSFSVVAVGDSITAGTGDPGAWVVPLNNLAVQAGLTVDWRGPSSYAVAPSIHHYGNSSWILEQMTAGIPTIISIYNPDCIMLLGGRNNMESDPLAAGAPAALTAFLDACHTAKPSIRICTLSITPSDNVAIMARTLVFRTQMQAAIEASVSYSLGLATDLNPGGSTLAELSRANMTDGVHPNASGDALIADNALVGLCQLAGRDPVFVR